MSRYRRLFILSLCVLLCTVAAAQDPAQQQIKAMQSISPGEIRSMVETLSSARFGGRYTGSPKFRQMAEYLARYFREWQLKPGADRNSYLQPWPVSYTVLGRHYRLAMVTEAGVKEYTAQKDYMPALFTATATVKAPVVFAGYGITAPEYGYDDYAGIDVKGKLLLIIKGMPTPDVQKWRKYDDHRVRMKNARDHGAAGVLYIYVVVAVPNGDYQDRFPVALVGPSVYQDCFAGTGKDYKSIVQTISETVRPMSFDTGKVFLLETEGVNHPNARGLNLVGYVEGSDPVLRKEVVLIGGHMDHLGEEPALFPGANDNASGTATVMQIARAFASCKVKPKRSVCFVAFGGEEMGLLGSKYLAAHPLPPFARIDGMVNLDMTGSGTSIRSSGGREYPDFYRHFAGANDSVRAELTESALTVPPNSDYGPFMEQGVPVLAFSSSSDAPRTGPMITHTPADTPDKINPDIAKQIAQLVFLGAWSYANR